MAASSARSSKKDHGGVVKLEEVKVEVKQEQTDDTETEQQVQALFDAGDADQTWTCTVSCHAGDRWFRCSGCGSLYSCSVEQVHLGPIKCHGEACIQAEEMLMSEIFPLEDAEHDDVAQAQTQIGFA